VCMPQAVSYAYPVVDPDADAPLPRYLPLLWDR
jgi:hypothetical protein